MSTNQSSVAHPLQEAGARRRHRAQDGAVRVGEESRGRHARQARQEMKHESWFFFNYDLVDTDFDIHERGGHGRVLGVEGDMYNPD